MTAILQPGEGPIRGVYLPADPAKAIPLGRAGTLDDVSKALLYLADPTSYVTGVNLDVAGGYRMGMLDGP